jgi:acetyl coenzyme A synthetase (ADP forming)-like protein
MAVSPRSVYPAHQDVDVVLRNGSTVRIRPVVPADLVPLTRFLESLSDESRLLRFFTVVKDVGWAARRFLDVDYKERHSLVAVRGDDEEIIAHGAYFLERPGRAEVALEVADPMHGMGLGTLLVGHLAAAAEAAGISVFTADILAENHRMLSVLRESGYPVTARASYGVIHVELPTSLSHEGLRAFEQREQTSAVAALKRFVEPSSIAVVGASRRRGSIGGELFHNLLASGFPGAVYPISPHPVVQSVAAYPDVREAPGPVELAVVAVPARAVAQAARACAEKGVRALVVISTGFAEAGAEGRERQKELLEVCRRAGMRLIGPNCMGILSTSPDHPVNATFAPGFPPRGRIGFLSQSGALGLAVIDQAAKLGLGLSTFVSVGNKADVSSNDVLEYWETDPNTDVVLLYLESFGNPRRFSRIARRVGRDKPILAVKSGRSSAGVRATSSHTGALLAASDITVDALFAQSGVIRADTLGELFDVATLLANQPAPAGRRVGVVTNSGGLGILCADASASEGLEVPELSGRTRAALAAFLPAEASTANPVDVLAGATPDDYERAIRTVAESGEVDALVVIFISPLRTPVAEVAAATRAATNGLGGRLPVLAVLTPDRGGPQAAGVPVYGFPEDAVRALARARAWAEWRSRPEEPAWRPPDAAVDEARAIIASALGRAGDGAWLSPEEIARLFGCYGIPLLEWRLASTPREAAGVAAALGCQVALKAFGDPLIHKSDAGAVVLALRGRRAVSRAARAMTARLESAGLRPEGFLVQPMAAGGVEMIVGVVHDRLFGPLVACGSGGTAVELLRNVRVGLAPLTQSDADGMIRELVTYPLLRGYRGSPAADVGALRDLLLRVGALAEDLPEVSELDLNPVLAAPDGASVVDARVRIETSPPQPPDWARPRLPRVEG